MLLPSNFNSYHASVLADLENKVKEVWSLPDAKEIIH
jgi:hypothetical protein